MKKIWAVVSVAVLLTLVSFVSCAKKEVAAEKIASPEISSSELGQSADKTEIARLRGLLEAAGKEFASLRENGTTLTQANKGLATELLAAKDALKAKESEIAALSRDLGKALEAGSKGKKVLMAQIATLNKEKSALIASHTSLSEKLAAVEADKAKLIGDISALKIFHSKAIKDANERLQKNETELMRTQEDALGHKVAAFSFLCLLLLDLAVSMYLRTLAAGANKPQPVTQ